VFSAENTTVSFSVPRETGSLGRPTTYLYTARAYL